MNNIKFDGICPLCKGYVNTCSCSIEDYKESTKKEIEKKLFNISKCPQCKSESIRFGIEKNGKTRCWCISCGYKAIVN
jgi:hypothetical protein